MCNFVASNTKLDVEFDAIYTAEDVGSYKPDQRNFDYMIAMLERNGIARSDILHTAESLFHDHVPARSFGLANVWIDRQRLSESGSWGATAAVEHRPSMAGTGPPGDSLRGLAPEISITPVAAATSSR